MSARLVVVGETVGMAVVAAEARLRLAEGLVLDDFKFFKGGDISHLFNDNIEDVELCLEQLVSESRILRARDGDNVIYKVPLTKESNDDCFDGNDDEDACKYKSE